MAYHAPYRWLTLLLLSLQIPLPQARANEDCGPRNSSTAQQQASHLVSTLQEELKPVEKQILNSPFIRQIQSGQLPCDRIAALAAEQQHIATHDLQSFRLMSERWSSPLEPQQPSPDWFRTLASQEAQAQPLLHAFAASMGLSPAALDHYKPRTNSQIYPARLAALASNGDRASAAAALLLNFPVFGEAMAAVRAGLMSHYGFQPEQLQFITAFANPLPPSFETGARQQIARGLEQGACPHRIRQAARRLQQAELAFWLAASEPPGSPLPSCPFRPLRP